MGKKSEFKSGIGYFILVLLIVVAIWGVFAYNWWVNFESWEELSKHGTLFTSVSSLFAGLAFVGVMYNIYIQREELKLTRQELNKQSDNQKKSAEIQAYSALLTSYINHQQNSLGKGKVKGLDNAEGKINKTEKRLEEKLKELNQ